MGRSATGYCRTCKESHYFGYGCYGTWFDGATTVAEWDQKATIEPSAASLFKNKLIREFLVEHEGHNIYIANDDLVSERGYLLYNDHDNSVILDFTNWRSIDKWTLNT